PAALGADGHRADVPLPLDHLDPRYGPRGEELQQGVPVEWWAVVERQGEGLLRPPGGPAPLTPQLGRTQPVAAAEERVEAADAGEAAGERHLRHGEVRLGEQALCVQEPVRLRELDRGGAILAPDHPAEL